MLKIREINPWKYLVYTIGLSIAFLMFGGLFVNLILPLIGINKPLSLMPLLISFDIFLLIFWIIAYKRNKDISFEIRPVNLDWLNKIFFITPAIFPLLSILGAITLNNNGPNYLTMIMLVGLIVYIFLLVLFRKKLNENIYPWGIIIISISLLFSFSLRSWHLPGTDPSIEFYVFQLTKSLSHWNFLQFNNPYNNCLSITILPTILSNFSNISGEYVYKAIFPIIYSFSIINLYLLAKKYLKSDLSLLTIFFYIIQLPFILWIAYLARQEIALFFFSLCLLVIFNDNFDLNIKEALILIFGFSLVVSHYSSIYVALFLLFFSFVINYCIKKIIIILNKRRHRNNKSINDFKIISNQYFVPGKLILILFIFTFIWYSVFTQSAVSINQILKDTVNNFNEEYKSSSVRDAFSLNPFSNNFTTTEQDLIDYSNSTQTTYSEMKNLHLYEADKYKGYSIFMVPIKINPISNIFLYNIMLIMQKIITSIFKLSFLVGAVYLLTNLLKKKKIDIEYISLTIGSIIILFAFIFIPYLSLKYNFERLYLQTLYILALPALLGIRLILKLFKRSKVIIVTILLIFTFYFFYNTGLITQIIGGEPNEILNNYGTSYVQNYTHDSELKSIEWLSRNHNKDYLIYVGGGGPEGRLMAYGNIVEGVKRDILPSVIDKRAYVYLGYSSVIYNVTERLFNGKQIFHNTPKDFLKNNKNLLYNNQYTEIYK
jgi:uncharacterized membrane protein